MTTTSANRFKQVEISPNSEQTQVFQTGSVLRSGSNFVSGPKLSIKLDDKNFLLWNQQVKGVILTHTIFTDY